MAPAFQISSWTQGSPTDTSLCLLAAVSPCLFLKALPSPHSSISPAPFSQPSSPPGCPRPTLPLAFWHMSPGSAGCFGDDQKARLQACLSSSFLNSNTFSLPGSGTAKAGPAEGTWGPRRSCHKAKAGQKAEPAPSPGHGRAGRDQRRGAFPARHRTASSGRIVTVTAESPGPHGNTACDAA